VALPRLNQDLLRTTSRFWNASGITIDTGGIDVKIGSPQSALVGGIEFDTPLGVTGGEVAAAGTKFELFPSQAAVAQAHFHRADLVPGLLRRIGPGPEARRAGRVPRPQTICSAMSGDAVPGRRTCGREQAKRVARPRNHRHLTLKNKTRTPGGRSCRCLPRGS
jgi:paraquat-inducible protein B